MDLFFEFFCHILFICDLQFTAIIAQPHPTSGFDIIRRDPVLSLNGIVPHIGKIYISVFRTEELNRFLFKNRLNYRIFRTFVSSEFYFVRQRDLKCVK